MNVSQTEWPLLHVILGKGSTWNGDDGKCRKQSRGMPSGQIQSGDLGMVRTAKRCPRREAKVESNQMTTDGLRTAGAPGNQLIGTGVQRLERRPAYQPWGSTLTFQHRAGVSWVHGLRHGVAMHPRGRHLREGMILLFTWESHNQAREKQPTTQQQLPQHYYREVESHSGLQLWGRCRDQVTEKRSRNNKGEMMQEGLVKKEAGERAMSQLSAGPSRPTSCEERTVRPTGRKETAIVCWAVSPHQSEASRWQNRRNSEEGNEMRRQPEELYYIHGDNVKAGWVPTGHRATWCHRITTGVLRR